MKKAVGYLYIGLVAIFLYAPIFALVVLSFNDGKSMSVFTGFSLKWYIEMFKSDIIIEAMFNTFTIAIISSIVSTVIGTMGAIGIESMGQKLQGGILTLNNIPMVNADIVTGISLMLCFILFRISLGYQTVLFAHITFSIPYVLLSVIPRINKKTENLYEAALDLGASKRYAFRKIVLPELMPGITSGFLLAFTMSVDDFIITYFTRGMGINTISTLIYSQVKVGIRPSLFAISTIIFLIALIALIIVNKKNNKERRIEPA